MFKYVNKAYIIWRKFHSVDSVWVDTLTYARSLLPSFIVKFCCLLIATKVTKLATLLFTSHRQDLSTHFSNILTYITLLALFTKPTLFQYHFFALHHLALFTPCMLLRHFSIRFDLHFSHAPYYAMRSLNPHTTFFATIILNGVWLNIIYPSLYSISPFMHCEFHFISKPV